MYRLYYNHKTNGDILFLVYEPESYPDRVEQRDDIVALYKEDRLIGVNFLHIGKIMKIRADGMIVTPEDKMVEVLSSMMENAGLPSLPPCTDSGYVVAKVLKIEEHPLNEKLSILTLDIKEKTLTTVTRYNNFKEGDHVVIAKDNCLRFDGSAFHARVERNIPIECELCSEKDLRLGEEDKKAIVANELSFGMDFFLR
ncbi:MAG: DUF4479 domain-containing protein [Bacilli bacterium]|nr:DUF4479 domain-containing protein [Bacilli bacterium]